MSDDSNFNCENNINEAARAYCDNLLPSVSREKYEKVFREFEAWCNRKKVKQITEEIVLVYIGGWKSTSVAEGYIENSIQNKINIAKKIQKQLLYSDMEKLTTMIELYISEICHKFQ
jgi:hypothetical protein